MKTGYAVLMQRRTNDDCPRCGNPLLYIPDAVEIGTVFKVDLDSRRQQTIKLGHVWTGEVITVIETGEIIPTEMLGFK